MAVTPVLAYDLPQPTRIGMKGGLGYISGTLTTSGTYVTDGFAFDLSSKFVAAPYFVTFSNPPGLLLCYDYNTTVASALAKVYRGASGNTAAGSSHTHAVALDSGASGSGGTGATAASGTAVTAGPSVSVTAGYLLYQVREDPSGADLTIVGGHAAHSANPREWDISSICGANAKAVKIRVVLGDDHANTWVKFYQKGEGVGYEDAWVWWNPDNHNSEEAFDITIEPDSSGIIYYHINNGAGAGNIVHLSATVLGWYEQVVLPSGGHTHTGPSHTHTGPDHTHAWGTLADAASVAEAAHTHAVSASALAEYGSGTALTISTAVRWFAFGRLN